jgi:hypothetical protein
MIISLLFSVTFGMESLELDEQRYHQDMHSFQAKHLKKCEKRFKKEFYSEEFTFLFWAKKQILEGKNAMGMLEYFLKYFPVYADGLLSWYINKSDEFCPPLIREEEINYIDSLMRYSSQKKKVEILDNILQKDDFSFEDYLRGSTLLEELPDHKEEYRLKINKLIEEAQGEIKENLLLFIDQLGDSGKETEEEIMKTYSIC